MAEGQLKYGLKLWSSNIELFSAALGAYRDDIFDFVELYSNPEEVPNLDSLAPLREMPVTIHATHSRGFHEFVIRDEQLKIWQQTLALADFFKSDVIVVHPGRTHSIESFEENLTRIDDPRIYIENMAGLDIYSNPMFGQRLTDLDKIASTKPICFDFEKAVKAACFQNVDYKEYIEEALERLRPSYFHISGGKIDSAVDEHLDLRQADFDLIWMKKKLNDAGDVRLVFETPKKDGIVNDLNNMQYFRSL